jgi:hypothetical protein
VSESSSDGRLSIYRVLARQYQESALFALAVVGEGKTQELFIVVE